MLTIGFLGGGNMAAALIGGLLKEKTEDLTVHVVDHHPEKLEKLEALGARTHKEPGDWITACDLLVLAVKPHEGGGGADREASEPEGRSAFDRCRH